MYEDINEHVNAREKLLYGSLENKETFFNGLKDIQDKHSEFFENKEDRLKSIENYFMLDNPSGIQILYFHKHINIDEEIKKDILELFHSIFD